MSFAEQQRRAHIERQRRLGKVPPLMVAPRPALVQAPPLAPQAERMASPAQVRMILALQQEVARLSASLKAMVHEDQSPFPMPSRIKAVISTVAKYYGLPPTDIVSFRRTKELVHPRHVAMYLAKELTKHSLPTIGRVMDRDHTTVLHGCRKIAKLRQEDSDLDAQIRELIEQLTPQSSGADHE